MAINVRLKDAGGQILHPETDWSVVQNKPSISVSSSGESWNRSSGTISINGGSAVILSTGSSIKIKDASTKGSEITLQNYPKDWSKISNKPRATELFGYVFTKAVSSSDPDEYWPAVAMKDSYDHNDFSVYKFNGSGWVKGRPSEFISFNDNDPN